MPDWKWVHSGGEKIMLTKGKKVFLQELTCLQRGKSEEPSKNKKG